MANVEPKYLVFVLRQNADGTISDSETSFAPDDRAGAMNKYYVECAAAVNAGKPIHLVQLMTTEGVVILSETFHNNVPEGA